MKIKFNRGQVVSVKGDQAIVVDIEIHDCEPDYLLRPVNYPIVDFCRCGEKTCGGVSWFRDSEFTEES